MNQNETGRIAKALALRSALIGDAESMTDEEIREEILGLDQDPDVVANELRAMTLSLVAEARKNRLAQATQRFKQQLSQEQSILKRSVDAVRSRLEMLAADPESMAGKKIALAFRNGTKQSDSDVLSLWQDLIDLGAVKDDELQD